MPKSAREREAEAWRVYLATTKGLQLDRYLLVEPYAWKRLVSKLERVIRERVVA